MPVAIYVRALKGKGHYPDHELNLMRSFAAHHSLDIAAEFIETWQTRGAALKSLNVALAERRVHGVIVMAHHLNGPRGTCRLLVYRGG
jgi:hypothetical protein